MSHHNRRHTFFITTDITFRNSKLWDSLYRVVYCRNDLKFHARAPRGFHNLPLYRYEIPLRGGRL